MKPIMGDPFETTASSFKRLLEMARESSEMQARIFRGFDAILIFIWYLTFDVHHLPKFHQAKWAFSFTFSNFGKNYLIKLLYNATVYLKTYFDLGLYTKTRNSHEEHVHF